jgi:hypothetical protein
MENPTFQTIRLGRGSHTAPERGACVMELASMLAGESFSDHPRSVCPVVGMVMRAYNDGIDDDRRQDLYAYASAAVGTRDRRERRRRLELCARFFGVRVGRGGVLLQSRLRMLGTQVIAYARDADAEAHRRFIALLDELIGGERPAVPAPSPVRAA